MSRPEPPDVVRARVMGRLRQLLPGLGQEEAAAALVAVNAHRHIGLHRLDGHLRRHPDALTAGSAAIPPSLLRLLVYLRKAGHPVRVPGCARCGRLRSLPEQRAEGRVCGSCGAQDRRRSCARCGRDGVVAAIGAEGPVCASCYAADPARHEPCSRCGRKARVRRRLADGSGLCGRCGAPPPESCGRCGRILAVTARLSDGQPLCSTCQEKRRARHPCGRCGRVRPVYVRAHDGQPDLCRGCWRGPLAVCVGCGRERPCLGTRSGAPRCGTCRIVATAGCARCGADRRCQARWPMGGVCPACYRYIRAHPRPCTNCGRTRPLIGTDDHGNPLCGVCSGAANPYLCLACGSGRETDRGPHCSRCVLARRLTTEFTGPDGTVPATLEPLQQALLRVPRAYSALVWLDKPHGGAAHLRHLLASGAPVTHEAFDTLGPGQGQAHLRATLVHLGILAPRHEPLAALQPWLERALATLPAQHRSLLRTYAQWAVLRQARRRATRRRFTSASATRARSTIRCAGAFLLWLDEHHIALADLTQHQVDVWLSGPLERRHVRSFLRWAQQRRLTGAHDVRPRPRGEAPTWFSDTEHWAHLRRCLHDETMPLDVRAAGALMLLYGVPVSRITELTRDRLCDGRQPALVLGDHPTVLPPAVHRLLRRQADHAQHASAIGRTTLRSAWIFPGYAAGTHRSPAALAAKLRRHHLPVHPSRNTALLTLAADLPAAVLSDLLGISITSALHWTRRAARDWNAYLASRQTVPRAFNGPR